MNLQENSGSSGCMKVSPKKPIVVSSLVIAAISLGNAGSTLYMPAMLAIGQDLGATNALVKLSLSIYLLSFGLSQLIYGPLSDAFGRRVNLLAGVLVFFLGSLLAIFSPSMWVFIVARIIQGIGIGTSVSVGYALFRDVFTGKGLAKQLTYMSAFVGMIPIIAPFIGGYLVEYIGWRSCFVLLAVVSFSLALAKFFFLHETNPVLLKSAIHPRVIVKNYWFLLRSPEFMKYLAVASFGFSALLVINGMLPFFLIGHLEVLPSLYGWLTICTGLGYVFGAFLAGRLVHKFTKPQIVGFSLALALLFGVVGIGVNLGKLVIWSVIAPLIGMLMGIGVLVPIASSGGMEPFPNLAGSEAALLGAFMFTSSSICVFVASVLSEKTINPLFLFLCGITLVVGVLFFLLTKFSSQKPN